MFTFSDEEIESEYEHEVVRHPIFPKTGFVFDERDRQVERSLVRL